MAGRDIGVVVPAGNHVKVAAAGTFVFIKSSTGELRIETDAGKNVDMEAGDKLIERGEGFPDFIAHNDSGVDITVVFVVGFGDYDKASLVGTVTVDQPSSIVDVVDVACAAGARTLISAAATTKRETLIRHLANNPGILRVGSVTVAAAQGLHITTSEQMTVNGGAAVYVWNTTGASIDVSVLEIHD